MSQEDHYELKPAEKKPEPPPPPRPKPGEPGWVEPVPIIEKADTLDYQGETVFDPEDVEKNKAMAILAYILFVIPLVAAPQSKFARFHANQGLLLFILWCVALLGVVMLEVFYWAVGVVLVKVPILVGFFSCVAYVLQPLLLVGVLALTIMGIVHAANGEKKRLPLFGHWTLIK